MTAVDQPLKASPRATAVGFIAILAWGFAALTVHITRGLPAFEALALGFAIGGAALTLWGRAAFGHFNFLRQSRRYYAFVVGIVFVNNAAFILGLRYAPIVAANLINYLWPLLIVVLSVPLLGRPLRWWHAMGALLGFAGCACLVAGDGGVALSREYLGGYFAAFTAAVSWAIYSLVLKRDFNHVPTQALGPSFLGVAVLCVLTWPVGYFFPGSFNIAWRLPTGLEAAAILTMGLCTLGLAYACWDYGARRGDVRVMGAGAYLTPLLSTLILVQLGDIMVGNDAWLGCLLIIFGAVLGGGREIFVRRQS